MALFAKANTSDTGDKISKDAERAEIIICGVLVEHNIPFLVMDHLIEALKAALPDSKVCFFT